VISVLSVSLCLCIPPLLSFEWLDKSKKPDIYIMGPEPISVAYVINPSDQSVCLYVYPPIITRQCLGKMLPRQQIHMQKQKNCWRCHFLCGSCCVKGK
jgi:hypothetical protein